MVFDSTDSSPAFVIETERLQLREMRDDDLEFLAALLSDPLVMRFYPKLLDRDEAQAWLNRRRMQYETHGHSLWLAQKRDDGGLIGQVGLVPQTIDERSESEIGYMLAARYWHHGYASEAARGVLAYARNELKKQRIISMIRPENEPSRNVARSMGMQVERTTVWYGFMHDVWVTEEATSRGS